MRGSGASPDAERKFRAWLAQHLTEDTLIVRTKCGGLHVWLWLPKGVAVPNISGINGMSVEVFGDDTHSVPLPGTLVGKHGAEYRCETNARVATAPKALLDALGAVPADQLRKNTAVTTAATKGSHGEGERQGAPGIAVWPSRGGRKHGKEKKRTQGETFRDILDTHVSEFWHTPDSEPFASIERDGHHEHLRIRSEDFREYIGYRFFKQEGRAPSAQALADALGVARGIAKYEGEEYPAHVRVAAEGEDIYLDLGSDDWSTIRVSPGDWVEVSDPPVRFWRPKGMKPLPVPSHEGDFFLLRRFINAGSEDDFLLMVAWVVASFRPGYPVCVLVLEGRAGSAKTSAAKYLRSCNDPNKAMVRSAPREEDHLLIAALHGLVVSLENISVMPNWLSDAICRLVTQGGLSKRTLYFDLEETIIEVQRPVLINGISADFITRDDLLQRSMIIELPPIAKTDRILERDLDPQFAEALPRIVGGLLDLLAGALDYMGAEHLDEYERMADFEDFLVALEPAMRDIGVDMPHRRLVNAFSDNVRSAAQRFLDVSPLAQALTEYCLDPAREFPMSKTASEWLNDLEEHCSQKLIKSKRWPGSARSFSTELRRLEETIVEVGLSVTRTRVSSRRVIVIDRREGAANENAT